MDPTEKKYDVAKLLRKSEYRIVSDYGSGDYCFDFIAGRKDEGKHLVIRVSEDVNQCSRQAIQDMKKLAVMIEGMPLLVSSKIGKKELESGIFYRKYGVFVVDEETLRLFLEEKNFPLIYADKGGLYAKINSEKLRMARRERGLSLGELAQKVGVSRKAIYEYERGNMDASLDVALKLEEILDTDLIEPITKLSELVRLDISKEKEKISDNILSLLYDILSKAGFDIWIFRKTPFDMAARKEKKEKKVIAKNTRKALREYELSILSEIADLVSACVFLIVKQKHGKNAEEVNEKVCVLSEQTLHKIQEIL
ncbi:MAG: hypothetical protein DRJ38_00670 [Thermoprotei archaeon]|nr:MAG: hypothetical protein DRJ38_00670 [Thermoprotei archaeon]